MGWFHTCFGISLAGLLFAIFWTGTLSVFEQEIHQWTVPEIRFSGPAGDISYDRMLEAIDEQVGAVTLISLRPPKDRVVAHRVEYRTPDGSYHTTYFDPETYVKLDLTESMGGAFFFDFHYMLHLHWNRLGLWLVAFAALSMIMLMVSGVFLHRKIIVDFFTLRPEKKARRFLLDLHNLTAVIGLPFYLMLCLSGILAMIAVYFPWSVTEPYAGDTAARLADLGVPPREAPTGSYRTPLSIDTTRHRIEALWSERQGAPAKVDRIQIDSPGDETSVVMWRSTSPADRVTVNNFLTYTDAATGDIVSDLDYGPAQATRNWLQGAHFVQFEHGPLRWLYFLAGLGGCVMIGSGMVYWLQSRIGRGDEQPAKVRLTRTITIGSTTGILVATGAFLIANRLLSEDAVAGGMGRASLEKAVFYGVWVATFVHAASRGRTAWIGQTRLIAACSVVAVLLNWITTGDHLVAAVSSGLWAVAGVDLVLLTAAGIAAGAGKKLSSPPGMAVSASAARRHLEPGLIAR